MRYTTTFSLRTILFCLLASLVLTASGCGPKPPLARTPDTQSGIPAKDIQAHALQAFESGDHAQSEVLNRRLLDKGGLSEDQAAEAWLRLAKSAVENGHPQVALEALDNLRRLRPESADSWTVNAITIAALMRSGQADKARTHLATLLTDPRRPWDLRFKAGLSLARDQWGDKRYEEAMHTLERLYADSPEPSPMPRGQLEAGLLAELQTVDGQTLAALVRLAPVQSQWNFPYTIIRLEQARRLGQQTDEWSQAWRLLTGLIRHGDISDQTLVTDILTPLRERLGVPTGGIILALPLSGPFAEIGWKTLRGAGLAQWEILTDGGQMNIRTINTDAPGWLAEIKSIPQGYSLMGGPLRLERFREMAAKGMLGNRPVFSFLPRLEGAVEGLDAWRFFTSPEDQVRALMRLAAGTLGIQEFAVFSPNEPFGERYAQAFGQEIAAWGASVNATGTYPPGEPTQWSKGVATLLGVDYTVPEDKRLPPTPAFQAVLLPDGWSQAKLLAPQFFFYDEDRLLLMGPAAWGQGLTRDPNIEMNYFRQAVFPGAWWADSPAPGTQALRQTMAADGLGEPDFWVALGYDFVHLAQALPPVPSAWSAADVNTALSTVRDVPWSMAPLTWGDFGQARQEMFLFQPTSEGLEILDPERLAKRLERSRMRHEERILFLEQKHEIDALRMQQKDEPDNLDVSNRLRDLLNRLEREKLEQQ